MKPTQRPEIALVLYPGAQIVAVLGLTDACATMELTFDGVTAPAAQVHAAMMAAFQFGYAAVLSTQDYLQRS